jgi:hypothetical protein
LNKISKNGQGLHSGYSVVIAAVAFFHSGDPDQVVPVLQYTVVLYTLTLHAGSKRTYGQRVRRREIQRQKGDKEEEKERDP